MDLLPEYHWTKDPFDKLRMTCDEGRAIGITLYSSDPLTQACRNEFSDIKRA